MDSCQKEKYGSQRMGYGRTAIRKEKVMPSWVVWLLRLIWPIVQPMLKKLAEEAWYQAERWMERNIGTAVKDPKFTSTGEYKAALWDFKMAENSFSKDLSKSDLNLLREITHKKMTRKA
jgi:hypothetical protein